VVCAPSLRRKDKSVIIGYGTGTSSEYDIKPHMSGNDIIDCAKRRNVIIKHWTGKFVVGNCCESDSKLEKLKFAEAVKIGARFGEIGARFFGAELTLSFVKNRSTIWQTRSTILRRFRKIKRIFGPDLLQFYKGYFYYKYRLCIRANLEIEGAETRV